MNAEDDVDAESLQAQVDMTMSFAHNLVTSWIKPSYRAQLRSSSINAASILEEELRRPPRLGVGVSIPSVPSLAHEASKLQHKLGKKGANSPDAMELHPQDPLKSDDEEHKGRPAKRKTNTDPFGRESRKKKRKSNLVANPRPSVENDPVSLLNGSTPVPLIHNPQIGPGDQRSVMSVSSLPGEVAYSGDVFTSTSVSSRSGPSRETSEAPVPGIMSAEFIGLHVNSAPIPDKASVPLLNLDGPPEFSDRPGNGGEMNGAKKRRKRRKKKKARTIAGTGDNLH